MGRLENLKPFKKGHKKLGGRKKGVPNKFPRTVKEAVVTAAENYGRDRKGSDGLVGFLSIVWEKHPKQFLKLFASRCLTLEKRAPRASYACHLELLTDEEVTEFERLLRKAQVPLVLSKAFNGTNLEPP